MEQTSPPTAVGSNAWLGVGANLRRDPYRLDFVLMPMVQMLAEQPLSWSQREQVARAMLATMRHHKSMTDEMQTHAASAQQPLQQQCHGMTTGPGMQNGDLAAMLQEQYRSRITPAPPR